MSVQAITWALSVKAGSPSAKALLLALANYADEFGVCWPGQARLANETDQSVDSVQRRLIDLEGLGLLSRSPRARRNNGRYGGDIYTLHLPSVSRRPSPQAAKSNQDEIASALQTKPQSAVRTGPQVAAPSTPQNQGDQAATVRSLDEPSIEPSPLNPPIAPNHDEALERACRLRPDGSSGVFIEEGTDEWKAWQIAFKQCGVQMLGAVSVFAEAAEGSTAICKRRGRRFPTRWPPGFEPVEQTQSRVPASNIQPFANWRKVPPDSPAGPSPPSRNCG